MPNFNYIFDIPFSSHNPSSDQPNMLTNNNNNKLIWEVDHFGFGNNNGGYHQQVHLKNESAPGLGSVDSVLYANSATGQSWPFWQNALGSFQLLGQNSFGASGYLTLPGPAANPLIIQWGLVNGTHAGKFQGGDTNNVTFSSTGIAFPNNCFNVWTQPLYTTTAPSSTGGMATVAIDTATLSKTQFTWTFITNSGDYSQFFWIALGN